MRRAISLFLSFWGSFIFAGALVFIAGEVHAATFAATAAQSPLNSTWAVINGAKNPLATPSNLQMAVNSLSNAGSGNVLLSSLLNMPVGAANGAKVPVTVPVTVASKYTPGMLAKGIVVGAARGIPAVATGLLISAGLSYALNQWSQTTSNGYWWSSNLPGQQFGDADTACTNTLAKQGITPPSYPYWGSVVGSSGAYAECHYIYEKTMGYHTSGASVSFTATGGSTTNPVSDAAAQARLTNTLTSYPDPAAVAYAWPSLLDPDPNMPAPVKSISVPSSKTGSSTSTTQMPATTNPVQAARTVTTTTTTTVASSSTVNPVDPANPNADPGATVTSTVSNTVSTSDPATGTTTTTDPATNDPQADTPPVIDTPMPDLPKLYTPKYPNGIKGVWDEQSGQMKATPLFSLTSLFTPNVGAGTCPNWTISANIGPSMNFGSGSISPPCWLWTALKAVMIISALMISRRLVFGG